MLKPSQIESVKMSIEHTARELGASHVEVAIHFDNHEYMEIRLSNIQKFKEEGREEEREE